MLAHKSDFGLQLKAKKCTFMQTEVGFLRHIVACDPAKLSAVRTWLAPDKVKAVHQFLWDIIASSLRILPNWRNRWWP